MSERKVRRAGTTWGEEVLRKGLYIGVSAGWSSRIIPVEDGDSKESRKEGQGRAEGPI